MKPVDHRNETFANLKTRLEGLRLEVWEALTAHGPCTTKELAVAMRPTEPLFLLDVRPRVTELCQLGFAVLVEETEDQEPQPEAPGHPSPVPGRSSSEGTYRACSDFEARRIFDATKRDALREQLTLRV